MFNLVLKLVGIHIMANCHTCGSDAITFVGSISSFEVTLSVCHNLGLLRFSLPKIGGGECTKFRSQFSVLIIFEFSPILSFFSFKGYFLLSDGFLADLKWRQQRERKRERERERERDIDREREREKKEGEREQQREKQHADIKRKRQLIWG